MQQTPTAKIHTSLNKLFAVQVIKTQLHFVVGLLWQTPQVSTMNRDRYVFKYLGGYVILISIALLILLIYLIIEIQQYQTHILRFFVILSAILTAASFLLIVLQSLQCNDYLCNYDQNMKNKFLPAFVFTIIALVITVAFSLWTSVLFSNLSVEYKLSQIYCNSNKIKQEELLRVVAEYKAVFNRTMRLHNLFKVNTIKGHLHLAIPFIINLFIIIQQIDQECNNRYQRWTHLGSNCLQKALQTDDFTIISIFPFLYIFCYHYHTKPRFIYCLPIIQMTSKANIQVIDVDDQSAPPPQPVRNSVYNKRTESKITYSNMFPTLSALLGKSKGMSEYVKTQLMPFNKEELLVDRVVRCRKKEKKSKNKTGQNQSKSQEIDISNNEEVKKKVDQNQIDQQKQKVMSLLHENGEDVMHLHEGSQNQNEKQLQNVQQQESTPLDVEIDLNPIISFIPFDHNQQKQKKKFQKYKNKKNFQENQNHEKISNSEEKFQQKMILEENQFEKRQAIDQNMMKIPINQQNKESLAEENHRMQIPLAQLNQKVPLQIPQIQNQQIKQPTIIQKYTQQIKNKILKYFPEMSDIIENLDSQQYLNIIQTIKVEVGQDILAQIKAENNISGENYIPLQQKNDFWVQPDQVNLQPQKFSDNQDQEWQKMRLQLLQIFPQNQQQIKCMNQAQVQFLISQIQKQKSNEQAQKLHEDPFVYQKVPLTYSKNDKQIIENVIFQGFQGQQAVNKINSSPSVQMQKSFDKPVEIINKTDKFDKQNSIEVSRQQCIQLCKQKYPNLVSELQQISDLNFSQICNNIKTILQPNIIKDDLQQIQASNKRNYQEMIQSNNQNQEQQIDEAPLKKNIQDFENKWVVKIKNHKATLQKISKQSQIIEKNIQNQPKQRTQSDTAAKNDKKIKQKSYLMIQIQEQSQADMSQNLHEKQKNVETQMIQSQSSTIQTLLKNLAIKFIKK